MAKLSTNIQGSPSALSELGAAVIIGANGGIGRALVERLSSLSAFQHIFAYGRNPSSALEASGMASSSVKWGRLDLTDEVLITAAAQQVRQAGPVSLVLVATGLLHDDQQQPEKTMRSLTAQAMLRSFQVNTVGPALVAKHFLPLMVRDQRSVFGVLSARVSSISDNRLGGWYSYRASKAALNMVIKTLALEHARKYPLGVCVGLHPGTVDTQLSKPFQSVVPSDRLFSTTQAAEHILSVVEHLTPADSGDLLAWDGRKIAP